MRNAPQALAAGLVTALLAPAATASPPKAIVLGHGDAAAVAELVALWPSVAGPTLRAAEGLPRSAPASVLAAFKGGPEVALAGICNGTKEAQLLRDLLRLSLPTVELVPLAAAAAEQCPTLSPRQASPLSKSTRVASGRVDDAVKTITWEVVSAGPPTRVDGNPVLLDLRLRVLAGKTLVDELTLTGAFAPTDHVGIGTLYTAELYRLGGRNVVLVREDKRADISGSTRLLLYGFYGGRVRELGAFKEGTQFAVVDGDWRRLRVYRTGQALEDGDAYRLDPVAGELVYDAEGAGAP